MDIMLHDTLTLLDIYIYICTEYMLNVFVDCYMKTKCIVPRFVAIYDMISLQY